MNLVLFTTIVFLFCSCGNIGKKQDNNAETNKEEKVCWYAYDYIIRVGTKKSKQEINGIKDGDFWGLAIKQACCVYDEEYLGDPEPDYSYLYFDDEADYNNEIKTWILACRIAWHLYYWNDSNCEYNNYFHAYMKTDYNKPYKSRYTLDYLAKHLEYLKDFPNTGMIPRDMSTPFAEAYYNYKDEPVYMPKSGYGYREYPVGNNGGKPSTHFQVYRAKNIEGIDDGTLIIH